MRIVCTIILSLWISTIHANDISKINNLKKEAEKAFKSKDYEKAIAKYAMLLDSMEVDDDAARLNMAHAQFEMQNPEEALKNYQKLVLSDDQQIKSLAYQQLGNLSSSPQDLNKALSYFKASIKADPSNEAARYNYEMVKKKLKNQQDQQDNQDQQNQEPSEWAKQIKKRAEELVANRQYKPALELMRTGLQKDPTVSYFSEFITRIDDIVQIVEK